MTDSRHNSQRAPESIRFAREQRRRANEFTSEAWQLVRGRQLLGEKFRREHPIGPYTLDFVCLDLKLDLEIDGKDHFTQDGKQNDAVRDAYLRSLGFEILRINGFRVTQDAGGVRKEIEQAIERRRSLLQNPSPTAQDGPSPPAWPDKNAGV